MINKTFNSLFINNEYKTQIMKSVDRLMNYKEYYDKYALPRKLSIMLYGPPGCGKTSVYLTIANHYHLPIYVIKPTMLENDSNIISTIKEKSIIVFEEIDTFNIENRDVTTEVDKKDSNVEKKKGKLNLILELLDGYYTLPNESIVIITTNHIDKLDSAVFRKGRVDHLLEIKYPNYNTVNSIFEHYYDNIKINHDIISKFADKLPTCEYTNTILHNLDDHKKALTYLHDLVDRS